LFPIGEPQFPGGDELLIKNAVGRAPFYNPDAPCIRLWHQFSQDQFVGRRKRIGFPIFELNRFTAQEQHQLKSLDHIIVCSRWAEQVIRDNGIDVPTTVVPLGVDTSIFRPRQDYREQRPPWLKDTTVFLNIGKWEVRKGHDQLLEAFNAAFEPGDNVEL